MMGDRETFLGTILEKLVDQGFSIQDISELFYHTLLATCDMYFNDELQNSDESGDKNE